MYTHTHGERENRLYTVPRQYIGVVMFPSYRPIFSSSNQMYVGVIIELAYNVSALDILHLNSSLSAFPVHKEIREISQRHSGVR